MLHQNIVATRFSGYKGADLAGRPGERKPQMLFFSRLRVRTRDREPLEGDRLRFYTVESLGEKRHRTPEGFLVCEDVPVARTGEQVYTPYDDVPIEPGPDGRIYVVRTEAEVFRPETMASGNGKAVVDDHPDDDVVLINWRGLACGTAMNFRRGPDSQSDLLLADLVITDQALIEAILDGKREISLGYDAEYVKLAPGRGEQRNILINHIALVEKGRCGPRCAIGDRRSVQDSATTDCGCQHKEIDMKRKIRDRVLDALRPFFKDKEAEAEKMADAVAEHMKDEEGGGGDVHLHLGPAGERVEDKDEFCTKDDFEAHVTKNDEEHKAMRDEIAALRSEMAKSKEPSETEKAAAKDAEERKKVEAEMKDEASSEEEKEEMGKAKDSALLEDSYQQTLADAEILVPGIRPAVTFDAAAAPHQTFKGAIIGTRRRALDLYYGTAVGRAFIDEQLRGLPFNVRDMASKDVTTMFRGAVAMQRAMNNAKAAGGGASQVRTSDFNHQNGKPSFGSTQVISADQLAKMAAEAWATPKS